MSEADLSRSLIEATENLGVERTVSKKAWKAMLERQFLAECSAFSPLMMSGPICTDGSEDRARALRKTGFIEALNKKPNANNKEDYMIGYNAGTSYEGPLNNPENRAIIGILL